MMERPDLFVIGRLLESLSSGPLRRTQLQQRAGLNYTVFQRYLDYLVRLQLVTVLPADDGRVDLSSKGVEAYRFLSEGLSRIFGLSSGTRTGPPRTA